MQRGARTNKLPEGLSVPCKELVIQVLAYLEVPAGLFISLKPTGVYALLDWACWGDYTPLPPASREGLLLFFAKRWSDCLDP